MENQEFNKAVNELQDAINSGMSFYEIQLLAERLGFRPEIESANTGKVQTVPIVFEAYKDKAN